MLYSVGVGLLLAAFFIGGFFFGATKGRNPDSLRKKNKTSQDQKRMETLAKNVANYQGNSDGQEKI